MAINQYTRLGVALALAALFVAPIVLAFDYPLSSEAIREAYFLAKADQRKRADFLADYTQTPAMPETGPHVSMIRLETPFAVVVERVAEAPNEQAPDAVQEFLGKPAVFRVHVQIDLTASYSWLMPSPPGTARFRSDDFWKDFTIRLVQDGKEIHSKAVRGHPIYFGGEDSVPQLTGAVVTLDYNAAKIDSAPADVHVLTPDGQEVKATFDLGALR